MKILIISSNLIGDNILSSGVINYFYNLYPNSKFTFLIGPTASQLYEHFPGLDKTIIIKKKKFNFHWIDMYKNSKNISWDIVIDLRSSFLSYFLTSKKKYIFKKNKKLHHIEQLNKSFNLNNNIMCVYTSQIEKKEVEENIDINSKHVVIFPGGNWEPKIWPAENYNILLKKLEKNFRNIKFIIVGSNSEKQKYLTKIQENIPNENIIDLMGKSLTLTSAYMEKSNLFIGNDSGLTHLSVASNLKTISLFGPTDDICYGHRSNNNFVLRTKESYDYFKQISIDKEKSYMHSIKTDQIIDIIVKNKLL